jgi:acrylyl-CoA reductase (NADPH)
MTEEFRAYRVEKEGTAFRGEVKKVGLDVLPAGEVVVEVLYSSLNYKDALSASGNPGVTRKFPHTPGIDAAGVVTASDRPDFCAGDEVLVTGYDLGMNTPGGFGARIRVPAAWVVPLPAGLSLREAMILGTGGLTVGLCVRALEQCGVTPDHGPVIVTGASGGVGSLAVALLARLGFEVAAGTGSTDAHGFLKSMGAAHIVERAELEGATQPPLLSSRWAGAVDTVGGTTLSNLIKSILPYGAVAVCGLVGGPAFESTVFPFILRGVSLVGIESAECPMAWRKEIWSRFAGPWKMDLEKMVKEITLHELGPAMEEILKGKTRGRILVNLEGK